MRKGPSRFLGNERGVTVIEYALIAALIAVVIIGALNTIPGAQVGHHGVPQQQTSGQKH